MFLSPALTGNFKWWKSNIENIRKPIRSTDFAIEIFSDASKTGWGAHPTEGKTHGFWNTEDQAHNINYLELLAAFFGLKFFAGNLQNCNVLLRIDNTTAITYINRMGGTHSRKLQEITKFIWMWCETRNIWIFASYISSKANHIADFESRRVESETEYELSDRAFQTICKKF